MLLPGPKPEGTRGYSADLRDPRTQLKILFILGAMPAAVAALFAPQAIALPLASLISIALAAAVGIFAWRRKVNYRSPGLTFWDLAGMLTFIGLGAGALSEPAAALELFGISATR